MFRGPSARGPDCDCSVHWFDNDNVDVQRWHEDYLWQALVELQRRPRRTVTGSNAWLRGITAPVYIHLAAATVVKLDRQSASREDPLVVRHRNGQPLFSSGQPGSASPLSMARESYLEYLSLLRPSPQIPAPISTYILKRYVTLLLRLYFDTRYFESTSLPCTTTTTTSDLAGD